MPTPPPSRTSPSRISVPRPTPTPHRPDVLSPPQNIDARFSLGGLRQATPVPVQSP
jgi:hypothetical protein